MDIQDSMRYYIKSSKEGRKGRKQILAKETLKQYLIVVQDYFYFLNNYCISNESLIAKFNSWENEVRILDAFVEEVAISEKLRDKAGMKPLSEVEKDALLALCDSHISNFSFSEDDYKSTKYKFYVSSLILKLLLEVGIKYRVIQTIIPSDLNFIGNEITFHSKYKIPISNKLSEQLKNYINIRECILHSKSIHSTELFIRFNEKLDPKVNTYVQEFLKKLGRSDTTGVSKYRIIKILTEGIPEIIIYELTTFESSVINDCKQYVYDYKEDYSMINKFLYDKFENGY